MISVLMKPENEMPNAGCGLSVWAKAAPEAAMMIRNASVFLSMSQFITESVRDGESDSRIDTAPRPRL